MLRIGVDIGGTFTDVCCAIESEAGRRVRWTKVPSTPRSPIQAVALGAAKILDLVGAPASAVVAFMHATTVATNAVLEQKGARVGVLMTDGFEDSLEIGRQLRTQMYRLDLEPETPGFLAPGRRRRGIRERISATGDVLIPLDEEDVLAATRELVDAEHVDALAICYLFSFVNPTHERRTRELVRSLYPRLPLSLSHEVDPVFREYERLVLTAFDAYLRPVLGDYLGALVEALRQVGVRCEVLTMQSRGGLSSTTMAGERPVTTLLSGPAAGVIGAKYVAALAGYTDCITLDMGGTSADIALVTAGKALTTTEGRIYRYPLRTPMVDVNTIGAGGGSIAWLDAAGGLRVGPQSAGADPGPACYRKGGSDATVTDASVVLGYIDPTQFAEGEVALDVDAAWRAVERIGARLGLSTPEAAHGIHRIVNAKMADEIRLVSVKRGYDPRRFNLVLFGGGGPVNGGALGIEMGIRRLMVPFAPGVLSAFGLLVSNVEYDHAVTFRAPAAQVEAAALERSFRELERMGVERMAKDGVPLDQVLCLHSADMRYVGQSYELEVPLEAGYDRAGVAAAVQLFHDTHERHYGHGNRQAAVEFVNLRTVHVYRLPAVRPDAARSDGAVAQLGSRPCYFPELGGFVDTPTYWRAALPRGAEITGPAVVHQTDTTTVVYPGYRCRVDDHGNLILAWE
ncbi:MAG: hydantoinase/oxoprolinase family protein [Chloroflexi bacterium]|nr:hydantoinase/oxoprolinase family protein [Chloroflexota bacterium]